MNGFLLSRLVKFQENIIERILPSIFIALKRVLFLFISPTMIVVLTSTNLGGRKTQNPV